METKTIQLMEKDELGFYISTCQDKLDALRINGEKRIEAIKNENLNIKFNKQLDKETKKVLIAENKNSIAEAKVVLNENKAEVSSIAKETISVLRENYKVYLKELKEKNAKKLARATEIYKEELANLKTVYINNVAQIRENREVELANVGDDKEAIKKVKENYNIQLSDEKLKYTNGVRDSKTRYKDIKFRYKDEVHQLYLEMLTAENNISNDKVNILHKTESKFENYVYNFNISNFLLSNGLYLAILGLLIVVIIYYGITNGQFLLNMDTILDVLEATAPKMFLALGVGCLIVLGGTDLSIGSLVGVGAVLTVMLCTTDGTTTLTAFGKPVAFTGMPLGARVPLGFLLSILACVGFTSIAGFFTAKFKMHPFVSTLSTQLMAIGLISIITENSRTGLPDGDLKNALTGRIEGVFPTMIIFAVIAIVIMWFIWNKTKFGKNLFAVGGNAEAATVSGISVFKITLLAFVLAGIYYGIGSSIFGIYSGSTFGTMGAGMEADAIAACVVGGVSFSGGVGKIRGIVIGAILFQAIQYILVLIGITDTNAQMLIKGIIILAAVALDCAKYLKKK